MSVNSKEGTTPITTQTSESTNAPSNPAATSAPPPVAREWIYLPPPPKASELERHPDGSYVLNTDVKPGESSEESGTS